MSSSDTCREIYFDNASTSYPKPEAVYAAIDAFARTCGASPGRGGYARAVAAEETVSRSRAAVARAIGAGDPSRIAFASGSTEALNWALKGLLVKAGDHAVVTALEHNAVLRPLQAITRSRGTTWTVVPCAPDGTVDPGAVAEAIRPETRLVCAVHASNVLGTLVPIGAIVRLAHERGIPVLVDGSQTAGAFPFSVDELGIDLFAFTGHKSLLGPPGTGGLYVRTGLEVETWKEGGTGTRSESLDPPVSMPEHLEAGTPNAWGLAGLLAGIETLLSAGIENVRRRELDAVTRLAEGFRATDGVTVYGPHDPARKVGIVSVNVSRLPPSEVGRLLGERYRIAVRTGLHCSPLVHEAIGTARTGGTVRFGIGPFNTAEHVEAAVQAIREIAAAVYRRKRGRNDGTDVRERGMALSLRDPGAA